MQLDIAEAVLRSCQRLAEVAKDIVADNATPDDVASSLVVEIRMLQELVDRLTV